jgi:hypothetical protein
MPSAKKIFGISHTRIAPNNLIPEVLAPEDGVQNIHPDVGVRVMIAVEINAPGIFEHAMHLLHALPEPRDVVLDSTRPAVLERADFSTVSPNAFVMTIAEERGIEVHEVHGVIRYGPQNFKVVTEYQFVHIHPLS